MSNRFEMAQTDSLCYKEETQTDSLCYKEETQTDSLCYKEDAQRRHRLTVYATKTTDF